LACVDGFNRPQPTFLQGCWGTGEAALPVDEQPLIDAVAQACAADGIATFIVGAPGGEASVDSGDDRRPWLSLAAELGGTAPSGCTHDGTGDEGYCHLDLVEEPDFAVALERALTTIAYSVMPGDYVIPPSETSESGLDAMRVVFTNGAGESLRLLRSESADCERGWYYSADAMQVTLCEVSCLKIKAEPEGLLEFLFGCEG
jgi:hypothetical protein